MAKKVMITDLERDLLQPYDSFTARVYTWGIRFASDFWGVLPNNLDQIMMFMNPDAEFDRAKVEKAIKDLYDTGLITYIGRNNFLMVVVDYGNTNFIKNMKMNHSLHNKQSDYVVQIKQAIKNGELKPYHLDLPAVHFSKKVQWIEWYENKELHNHSSIDPTTKQTKTEFDKLMYKDVYIEYHKRKEADDESQNGLPF